MAILISDKVGYRTKSITKDRERYYMMAKVSVHEDIALLTPKQQSCKIYKGKRDRIGRRNRKTNPLIFRRIKHFFLAVDRTTRQIIR